MHNFVSLIIEHISVEYVLCFVSKNGYNILMVFNVLLGGYLTVMKMWGKVLLFQRIQLKLILCAMYNS